MIKILRRIPLKSEFAKNALILTMGTTIAQAFPMIFYPVLGRIYTPAEFGLLATIISIIPILKVISTGKYEGCVLIADSKSDAANFIGLSLFLSFLILLLSFIVLQLFAARFNEWFNEPNLNNWLFVCPISAFCLVIFNCYNEWCVRNKYFVRLSWNKIINSSSITLSKLLFGIVKIFSNGLVVGDLVGRIISAGGCIYRGLQKDKAEFFQISFERMKYLAKKYKEFPINYMPGDLLNIVGYSAPVLLIGAFYNSQEVGYFSMTMNVLSVPISVISLAIKDVFRQKANELYIKTGSCQEIYKRLLKILLFWTFLSSIVLFFILPEIFSIVLGKQWRIAGEYSQILLPMIALDFIAVSLDGVFIITKKVKVVLYWQSYYLIISIISFSLSSIFFHDIRYSLICFSAGRITAYLLHILLSVKYSKGYNTNE